MKKIYLGPIENSNDVFYIFKNVLKLSNSSNVNFEEGRVFDFQGFEIVETVEESDIVFFPYNISSLKSKYLTLVAEYKEVAKRNNKKLIVSACGDLADKVAVDDCILLKNSIYAYSMRKNEICIPAFSEDLGLSEDVVFRNKAPMPVIGFCGWAGFNNNWLYVKYCVKILTLMAKGVLDKNIIYRIPGLYFRRKIIGIIKKNPFMVSNFIIRNSYSGHKKTILLDPVKARSEFIQNVKDSDFVLAPKGDGNFSNRFYETLSMGRIPVIIDTSVVLPLQNFIDYNKFIVITPIKSINKIDEQILEIYNSMSANDYLNMQHEALRTYRELLNPVSFFNFFFNTLIDTHDA